MCIACPLGYMGVRDLRKHIRKKHPEQLEDEARIKKAKEKYY